MKALRAEQISNALTDSPGEFVRVSEISRAITNEEVSRVVGHQWAYLDVLKPDAASDIALLVSNGHLAKATELLKVIKRAYVSPYTGALAGECIWGPTDLERFVRLSEGGELSGELAQGKTRSEAERFAEQPSAALQVMLEELARMPGIAVMRKPSAERLVELQSRDDWNTIKHEIFDLLLLLARLAQADDYNPKKVEELRFWLTQQREMLKFFRLGEDIPDGISDGIGALVGLGIGVVLNPGSLYAAAAGGFMGRTLGSYGKMVGVELGYWAHKMARPEHHRLLAGLDKLAAT